jgi:hypothetical protein
MTHKDKHLIRKYLAGINISSMFFFFRYSDDLIICENKFEDFAFFVKNYNNPDRLMTELRKRYIDTSPIMCVDKEYTTSLFRFVKYLKNIKII